MTMFLACPPFLTELLTTLRIVLLSAPFSRDLNSCRTPSTKASPCRPAPTAPSRGFFSTFLPKPSKNSATARSLESVKPFNLDAAASKISSMTSVSGLRPFRATPAGTKGINVPSAVAPPLSRGEFFTVRTDPGNQFGAVGDLSCDRCDREQPPRPPPRLPERTRGTIGAAAEILVQPVTCTTIVAEVEPTACASAAVPSAPGIRRLDNLRPPVINWVVAEEPPPNSPPRSCPRFVVDLGPYPDSRYLPSGRTARSPHRP